MSKQRPSKASWDVRAADILAGRTAVDPGELIDLIHEVNPTGRGRGASETAARYALKSRLQSLLVNRFAADLEVSPDPGDPGVASIRHRYRRHDACHAVITALDDDARSWVQRQLDMERSARPEPAPASEEGPASEASTAADEDDEDASAEELIAAGEEAQAAYDYERAGRCFSRAVAASGGGVAAAVCYLAFAVDAMAADEEALAVEARLPAATLADPRVAHLLALAAARAGDEARAIRHLSRAREARAAEVWAILARQALEAGDTERAARHMRAAEERDPAHPDLRALADGIARARLAERAPREAELAALMAAGSDAEALAAANAILGRWPESEPARRALRQIEERLREGAGRLLLAGAEQSLAQGETAVARDRLARALAGPLPAPARERALSLLREVEATERAQAARVQVEQVVSLLSEADRARGLGAYAELDEEARAAVRARVPIPALQWLDHIPAARPGGRVRAAVEAVLALQRAAAIADKDPAAAAALVAAHERVLEEVPLARSIEQRARAAAAEERARRRAAALREAEEALAAGQLVQARELVDRLDLRASPEDERARAAGLEAALSTAEERMRDVRRFERLRAAGSFVAAAAAARALAERDDPERWTKEAAAIVEHARARYAVKVDAVDGGPELLQSASFSRYYRGASAWVAEGGRELVLCNTEHAWMFVRFVDLGTGRVVRVMRVALDEPMHDRSVTVDQDRVVVMGISGVFEIASPSGEVLRRFDRNWNRDRGLCFTHGVLGADHRTLWGRYGIDDEVVKIVDMDGELGGKTFTGIDGPLAIPGSHRIALHRQYDEAEENRAYTLQIHEPSGAPAGRVDGRWKPEAVVAHPSGAGFVALSVVYHAEQANRVIIAEISERFEVIASKVLEPSAVGWPYGVPEIASSRDAGMLFVRFGVGQESAFLVALRSAGPGIPLVPCYRAPVPVRTTLAHDRASRRAFAVVDHPGGVAIAELGGEPPVLPESGPLHVALDPMQNVNWCAQEKETNPRAIDVYVELRRLPFEKRLARIAELEAAALEMRETLFYALVNGGWLALAEGVLAHLQASHPDEPMVRRAPFALLVARRAWGELRDALQAAGTASFPGKMEQHYHHLLATAHTHEGDLEAARRHLELAEAIRDMQCGYRLGPLRQAFDSLTSAPGASGDLAFDRSSYAQIAAVLRAADACLAQGDPAGAIAILERPVVWDLREVHTLCRLAAAHLDLPCSTAADRFRRAFALATFVECVADDRGGNRSEAPVPGLAWAEERIVALRDASIAWLEADQGVPRAEAWLE
jgi:hypothetical protein